MIQVLVAHSYTLSIPEAEGNTPNSQSHPGLHRESARIKEGDPVSKLQAETKMKNKVNKRDKCYQSTD